MNGAAPDQMKRLLVNMMVVFCFCCTFILVRDSFSQVKSKLDGSPPVSSGRTEQGKFKIFFNGEQIGEEKFQILDDGSNFKASAEIHLTVEREKEKITFRINPSLQFTGLFEPITYQVVQEAGPNKTKARINFKPGRSEVVYETGQGEDSREIELKPDVVVLDDNVFHHYILLAKRYDFLKGGLQEFAAFIPQQFLAGTISVDDKGFERVTLNDKTLSLQHLFVDSGELQFSLWLNERHELLKISVPKSNVEVVRE